MNTEKLTVYLHGQPSGAILQTYFMDASKELLHSTKRPAVLLMPGGAYRYTSDREAEPVALRFNGVSGSGAALFLCSCRLSPGSA